MKSQNNSYPGKLKNNFLYRNLYYEKKARNQLMNPHVEGDSRTVKPFKFSDSFLAGFNALITTYDKKIEDLNKVKSLIDKDAHHGVCNCSYKMRYITPSDISTFISNLERAMEKTISSNLTLQTVIFSLLSLLRDSSMVMDAFLSMLQL